MSDPKYHQTYLMVRDIDQSIQFYSELIGLSVNQRGKRSATVNAGAGELKFEQDFDPETLDAFGLDPPGADRGAGLIIGIQVDTLDPVYDRLKEADADLLIEPREVDWGRELFLVQDPDGYVLEVSRPIE